MATEAYENVIKKLAQTGRNYLDGFTVGEFESLQSNEVSDIRDKLFDRAQRGDGIALDGLKKLLPVDDYIVLADRLASQEDISDLLRAQAVTSICEVGKSARIEEWVRLITFLTNPAPSVRRWILNRLPELSPPPEVRETLIDSVSDLIATESDSVILMMGSGVFLHLFGFVPQTYEYVEFALRLQSSRRTDREVAIGEIRQHRCSVL